MIFGDKIVLKFFRRLGPGVNPELEIGRFLTEKNFPHSPKLLGALEYHADAESPMTLAVAKAFVPHAKNGWKFTLDAITRYYDRVFADAAQGHNPSATPAVGPLKPVHHIIRPPRPRNMSKPISNPRGCWASGPRNCIWRSRPARRAASFLRSR